MNYAEATQIIEELKNRKVCLEYPERQAISAIRKRIEEAYIIPDYLSKNLNIIVDKYIHNKPSEATKKKALRLTKPRGWRYDTWVPDGKNEILE